MERLPAQKSPEANSSKKGQAKTQAPSKVKIAGLDASDPLASISEALKQMSERLAVRKKVVKALGGAKKSTHETPVLAEW